MRVNSVVIYRFFVNAMREEEELLKLMGREA